MYVFIFLIYLLCVSPLLFIELNCCLHTPTRSWTSFQKKLREKPLCVRENNCHTPPWTWNKKRGDCCITPTIIWLPSIGLGSGLGSGLTLLGLQSRFGDNCGQTTWNSGALSPKRDWSSKGLVLFIRLVRARSVTDYFLGWVGEKLASPNLLLETRSGGGGSSSQALGKRDKLRRIWKQGLFRFPLVFRLCFFFSVFSCFNGAYGPTLRGVQTLYKCNY